MYEEDIFNEAAQSKEIAIKYGNHIQEKFDSSKNKCSFEEFKSYINNREVRCYFSKKNTEEGLITIPIESPQGQLEIVVSYEQYCFNIKINRQKKTRFVPMNTLPEPKYSFEQTCLIKLIKSEEQYSNFDAFKEMKSINDRMMALEIAPRTMIENQRDIWTSYTKAQKLIIKDLQSPYECTGYLQPEKLLGNDGETVKSYRFTVNLKVNDKSEYKELENDLKDTLGIETEFEADGTTQMSYDDITRGLDTIIQKKYPSVFDREKEIGCILTIRPYNLRERMIQRYGQESFSFEISGPYVLIYDLKEDIQKISEKINEDFELKKSNIVFLQYRILSTNNVYTSHHVEKFNLCFGQEDPEKEKYILLPEPIQSQTPNCFRIKGCSIEDAKEKSQVLREVLSYVYGQGNVKETVMYAFHKPESSTFNQVFSYEDWNDIYKDLYALDFEITPGEKSDQNARTLYFEFNDHNDLEEKYREITVNNKFCVVKSPLDDDFKFKVKTNLLDKKDEKQIFRDKLDKLNGVDFVTLSEDSINKTIIGKLVARESSMSQLVFRLPNYYESDKTIAKEFLKYLAKNPDIRKVQANLAGDFAKITWLDNAMAKIQDNYVHKGLPNEKPANPNIKDFIFDSSKARSTAKYDINEIEETHEFVNFDRTAILKLNNSQKKSVLRALYADDMCMLQGPPGTGKTTVIAELIWQHIRKSQNSRLMLTSETNLAVDNALEKLMNEKNANPPLARYLTIIKPIRFGKTNKLEEEGKRYSIERIMDWLGESDNKIESEYDNDEPALGESEVIEDQEAPPNPDENAVQHWMRAIADRCQINDPKYQTILDNWTKDLAMPDKNAKHIFKDKYFKYANVIGSTCSSTGSPRFEREYQTIFNNKSTDSVKKIKEIRFLMEKAPQSRKIQTLIDDLGLDYIETPFANNFENLKTALDNLQNIYFDTVIMDEASKATPPELLMPLCFGKKSIIIGDHRQLPPMLFDKDFKEALLELNDPKAQALAEEIDKDFVETSQFKRLILNPKVSHTIKSTFNEQYRMHPYINDVIKQFYEGDEGGGLSCGLNPNKVNSPNLNEPESRYHGLSHDGFINDDIHTIWVNVDAPEENSGASKINHTEISVIKTVLQYIRHSKGFEEYMQHWDTLKSEHKRRQEKEIGLISFYGKQVGLISNEVRPTANKLRIPVRINTVDKFQGMERNIIIVSTVRSNKSKKANGQIIKNTSPGFAQSPERLNVALSRARRLLIVVGNMEFFKNIQDRDGRYLYRNAINEIQAKGRIIEYKDLKLYNETK